MSTITPPSGDEGPSVRSDRRGDVVEVVLDRPHDMNRFAGTMREQLLDAVRRATSDPSVGCVVLRGEGEHFCAGAELGSMLELQAADDAEEVRRRVELGGEVVGLIRSSPVPFVAALDGAVAGAGAGLALACDIRVGTTRCRMVQAFVRLGLVPDWGSFHALVGAVGAGDAAEILMTGRAVDAERLRRYGLLQRVVEPDELLEEARGLAERIASLPRPALALVKQGIRMAADGASPQDLLQFEVEAQGELFLTGECRDALSAFARGG
jgi:2-(1,2-epoxy-1,2-dihydrophenyl)acetyl-CoA isomerase